MNSLKGRDPARVLIGIVGVVLLGVTTYWSLTNDKEAVALALVAVGFLFTYLGYTGQILTSFKGPGGTEAAFAELAVTVRQLLDDPEVPEEVKGKVADGVESARTQLPVAVVRAVDRTQTARRLAMDYERRVKTALRSILADKGWTLEEDRELPYDLLVRSQDGEQVAVEIRWSRGQASQQQLARWRRELDAAGSHVLLITSSAPGKLHTRDAVRWASEADTPALAAALQRVMPVVHKERPRHDAR